MCLIVQLNAVLVKRSNRLIDSCVLFWRLTIWVVFVWFIIPFVVTRGAAGCKTTRLDARSSSLGYLGFLVGWIVSFGCDGFGNLSTLRGRNKDSFNFFVGFLGPSLSVYSVWLLSMNVLACLLHEWNCMSCFWWWWDGFVYRVFMMKMFLYFPFLCSFEDLTLLSLYTSQALTVIISFSLCFGAFWVFSGCLISVQCFAGHGISSTWSGWNLTAFYSLRTKDIILAVREALRGQEKCPRHPRWGDRDRRRLITRGPTVLGVCCLQNKKMMNSLCSLICRKLRGRTSYWNHRRTLTTQSVMLVNVILLPLLPSHSIAYLFLLLTIFYIFLSFHQQNWATSRK